MSVFALCRNTLLLLSTSALLAGYALADARQRTLYLEAKEAFAKHDQTRADQLLRELAGYPLLPYLQLRQLKRDIDRLPDQKLADFIHTYHQAPFADNVQRFRLDHLFAQQDWVGYQHAYQQLPLSAQFYQCQRARVTLAQGQHTQAWQQASELWLSGNSVDAACDPLFAEWFKAGYPSAKQARQRLWLAVSEGNFSLARYLQRFLGKQGQQDAQLIEKIYQSPEQILDDLRIRHDLAEHAMLAEYAIRQLARKDIDQGAHAWLKLRQQLAFNQAQQDQLNRYFGLRYAKGYRTNAQTMLAAIDPDFNYPLLTEWRIRLALSQQNWEQVQNLIKRLPAEHQQDERWRYWQASAQRHLGQKDIRPTLQQLSQERSFYGFLSAQALAARYQLNAQPVAFASQQKADLTTLPAVQRIRELLALGYDSAARSEWNYLSRQLNNDEKHALAHLAHDWQWHDQAIWGASRVQAWDDLLIRFPNPHQQLFTELAKERGIYRTWAIAIARQESAFRSNARSRAGARGLMQLMPATAKATADKFAVLYSHPDQLYTVDTNIALGTAYLAQMLERFDGNRVYATAAYNAGPSRVNQWRQARGELPLDIWIETIPFDETRRYVQNVLTYSVIYDLLNGQPTALLSNQADTTLASAQQRPPDAQQL